METSTDQPTPTAAPVASNIKWDQVKPWVFGGGIFVVVLIIITGIVATIGEMTQKRIHNEYIQLTDDAARTNFAKRYAQHPLGGLVLLGQANKYFDQGNYAAALSAFGKAAQGGLKSNPVLAQQAQLGEAFSQYYLDPTKGVVLLQQLATNTDLLESTRAYAAYELMSKALYEKDFDQAAEYAQLLRSMPSATIWQQQLMTLSQIYPEISAQ